MFPVSIWGKDVENELRRLVQTEETVASESQSDLVSNWEWYRNVTWAQKERGGLAERREISHSCEKQHEVPKLLSQTGLSLDEPKLTLLGLDLDYTLCLRIVNETMVE